MSEDKSSNVSSAFDMLLEEIEAEIDSASRTGAGALEGRDYVKAREALERSEALTAFRDRIAALRTEWEALAAATEGDEAGEDRADRRNLGRLRRGQRTPEPEYYIPILRVLEKMGGKGEVGEVLEQVNRAMKSILRKVDYEPLASDPHSPRWRNAAQWARNSMVHEGLLKPNSPRGVWEITDRGRDRLRESRQSEKTTS